MAGPNDPGWAGGAAPNPGQSIGTQATRCARRSASGAISACVAMDESAGRRMASGGDPPGGGGDGNEDAGMADVR